MINKILEEDIINFAESCTLEDDVDDRCFSAAFAGVIEGLRLSKEYYKEDIDEFLKNYER